jgi:hypothetical protein
MSCEPPPPLSPGQEPGTGSRLAAKGSQAQNWGSPSGIEMPSEAHLVEIAFYDAEKSPE